MAEATKIPTRQDDPAWFMFFRFDEIVPFMCFLVIGIFFRVLMPCLLLGWLFSYIYKRLNVRFPRGFVIYWCYGHGLWLFSSSRTFKYPFNRKFLPCRLRASKAGASAFMSEKATQGE